MLKNESILPPCDPAGLDSSSGSPLPDDASASSGLFFKTCNWCGDRVNPRDCYATFMAQNWLCDLCGKAVA